MPERPFANSEQEGNSPALNNEQSNGEEEDDDDENQSDNEVCLCTERTLATWIDATR